MMRWIGPALVVGFVAASPAIAAAATRASAPAIDIGARRHLRHDDGMRRCAPCAPHYYARPVYYRPYPYAVPAPFVFGFGPFWR